MKAASKVSDPKGAKVVAPTRSKSNASTAPPPTLAPAEVPAQPERKSRKSKLTIPIHQDNTMDYSFHADSPPKRRTSSRGSGGSGVMSRSSSRGSFGSASGREFTGLTANLKAVVAAAKASGAMATRVELLAASTKLPAVKGQAASDSKKAADAGAQATLQNRELARLHTREESNTKAIKEQTILQSEADKRLKAEQQNFQKILKVKEDDVAHLRHVVETMQVRENKLLAQNRQLQLEVSRALTERDNHFIDVQAKDHIIDELQAKIREMHEQLKEKSDITEHLSDMVNRHTAKSFVRERETRAEVAALMNRLQAQMDKLAETLTTRLEQVAALVENEPKSDVPEQLLRAAEDRLPLPSHQLTADVLLDAQNRYLGRENKLEQARKLNLAIDESGQEFVRLLYKTKLAVSVLPDSLFLVKRGLSIHSNLDPGLRDHLSRMTKMELLTTIDCLSHEEVVKNFMACEFPLYTSMNMSSESEMADM